MNRIRIPLQLCETPGGNYVSGLEGIVIFLKKIVTKSTWLFTSLKANFRESLTRRTA